MMNIIRRAYVTSSKAVEQAHAHSPSKHATKMEFVPVYVTLGMIALSLSFGFFTAQHQMLNCPNVRVRKKMRESVPEVEDPVTVVEEADKFLKKSFFRKIAHVQQASEKLQEQPLRGDVFAHTPKAHSLQSVGLNPKQA